MHLGICLQNCEVNQGHTHIAGDLPGSLGRLYRDGIQPHITAHLHFIPALAVKFLKRTKGIIPGSNLPVTPRAHMELSSEGCSFKDPEPVKEKGIGARIILHHGTEI